MIYTNTTMNLYIIKERLYVFPTIMATLLPSNQLGRKGVCSYVDQCNHTKLNRQDCLNYWTIVYQVVCPLLILLMKIA